MDVADPQVNYVSTFSWQMSYFYAFYLLYQLDETKEHASIMTAVEHTPWLGIQGSGNFVTHLHTLFPFFTQFHYTSRV